MCGIRNSGTGNHEGSDSSDEMGREKMVCQAWIIKTDAYIITAKKIKKVKKHS